MGVAPSSLFPSISPDQFKVPETLAPADERTVFLMFSKGFKVTESELREFLTQCFGNCIDSLNVAENQTDEQPLFVQIVFYSPEVIDAVLDGDMKAKITVKGKHVFVRKFAF